MPLHNAKQIDNQAQTNTEDGLGKYKIPYFQNSTAQELRNHEHSLVNVSGFMNKGKEKDSSCAG